MKIAIIGTRGIPNNYGGFEQFAEYLAVGLVDRGHEVTVYNTSLHPYKEVAYRGVTIIEKWSPENSIGFLANFIYDYLCLRDALKKKYDIIYEAGYQSNAISHLLLNINSSLIVTNMDGLEWKRAKWGSLTKKVTRYFEKLAVKTSHYLVADNVGIQEYILETYGKASTFLAYGADLVEKYDAEILSGYDVQPHKYYLVIARLEPENNIEMIVDGYLQSKTSDPLLIIGKKDTKFYKQLEQKTAGAANIRFIGGVYDKGILDSLRKYALAYFHGHSVGGTNPSLLEAMASDAFIAAHNNSFNKTVLMGNALFFQSKEDVCGHILRMDEERLQHCDVFIEANRALIRENYSWETIVNRYEIMFKKIIDENSNRNAG